MKVTIYTTTTCPFCNMLKVYLEGKGITYSEKLVDQDDAARIEMATKSKGYLGVPFSVFTKEDGQEVSVIGFDQARIDSVLESN